MQIKSKYQVYLATLGVVYGDIGTNPLFALKSCVTAAGLEITAFNIMGLISLFVWSLLLVVSIKYVNIAMYIENKGEGGIIALASKCAQAHRGHFKKIPLILGVSGTALFFGDSVLTPAVSVLGALEGLNVVSQHFQPYILPVSLVVITFLFWIQYIGSWRIGHYFGYIMWFWFVTIGISGFCGLCQNFLILKALNPYHAISFLLHNKFVGFIVFGASILTITGAEALYADMGHFGRKPIQMTWDCFILPSLLLNYLGQGALLLNDPNAITNPFYKLFPEYFLYPTIILATCATVIASQSAISGLFSLTSQAVMLNLMPRMKIVHTSHTYIGQVYVPFINALVYILTITAVLYFQTSNNLAAAYGLSVSGIMLITTFLIILYAHKEWKWSVLKSICVFSLFLIADTFYVLSNLIKIIEGAWYTLLITAVIGYIMYVWSTVNKSMSYYYDHLYVNTKPYLYNYAHKSKRRIPGTAIFMTRNPKNTPSALMLHLKHNRYLFKKTILLSLVTKEASKVKSRNRITVSEITDGIFQITANYGFKELPNLHRLERILVEKKIIKENEEFHYFLSRRISISSRKVFWRGLKERLFVLIAKLTPAPQDFYQMPHTKVVEIVTRFGV